jgi:hypothetical protein
MKKKANQNDVAELAAEMLRAQGNIESLANDPPRVHEAMNNAMDALEKEGSLKRYESDRWDQDNMRRKVLRLIFNDTPKRYGKEAKKFANNSASFALGGES